TAGAISSLVRNALDATRSPHPVRLRVEADERALRITVRDEGPGMTAEVLARAVEPFFSTKPPGKGMGLGLFLAGTLAEGLGGRRGRRGGGPADAPVRAGRRGDRAPGAPPRRGRGGEGEPWRLRSRGRCSWSTTTRCSAAAWRGPSASGAGRSARPPTWPARC